MERIVDIATDGLHLSAHRGFLMVEQEREEVGRVALDDVHAVIVHAHGVTWTCNLVARLAERGAPIVFCAANHNPVAVTLKVITPSARGCGRSGTSRARLRSSSGGESCRPRSRCRDRCWRRVTRPAPPASR